MKHDRWSFFIKSQFITLIRLKRTGNRCLGHYRPTSGARPVQSNFLQYKNVLAHFHASSAAINRRIKARPRGKKKERESQRDRLGLGAIASVPRFLRVINQTRVKSQIKKKRGDSERERKKKGEIEGGDRGGGENKRKVERRKWGEKKRGECRPGILYQPLNYRSEHRDRWPLGVAAATKGKIRPRGGVGWWTSVLPSTAEIDPPLSLSLSVECDSRHRIRSKMSERLLNGRVTDSTPGAITPESFEFNWFLWNTK